MKKIGVCTVVLALVLGACASPAPPIPKSYSTPSCKIAGKALGVLPFYSDIQSVGLVVSDTVGANLIDSGCKVIERSYLTSILEEHGLSQAGITESIDYRKIGKITSVDYLLVGNVEAKDLRPKWLSCNRSRPRRIRPLGQACRSPRLYL